MIKTRSVPFPIDGVYFVKSNTIENIIKMIEDRDKQRKELVDKAVKQYDTAIDAFAAKYPTFYERAKSKYISKERFAERFYFTYQFIKISAPDKGLISPEQYKLEMRKFKENIESMKAEVIATVYQVLSEMTARLRKQCKNDKPNQRTFNNLSKFLNQIEETYADFIDRDDLKEVIRKTKAQVLGITAEEIRNSESAKTKFEKAIKSLANEIEALPDLQLKRAIDF